MSPFCDGATVIRRGWSSRHPSIIPPAGNCRSRFETCPYASQDSACGLVDASALENVIDTSAQAGRPFRFFDNREKYLLFVTTCNEKQVIAERVASDTRHLEPTPPSLRLFDAGMGDATVLTRVMRYLHHRFPTVPFLVVAKEISQEDVRISLEKMADRLYEHPHTVLVLTNLLYGRLAIEAGYITPEEFENPIDERQLARLNEIGELTDEEWESVKDFARHFLSSRLGRPVARRRTPRLVAPPWRG